MTEQRVEYEVTARVLVAGEIANLQRSGTLRRQARTRAAYGAFFLILSAGGLYMAPLRKFDESAWLAFFLLSFSIGWTLIVSARHYTAEVRKSLLKECERPGHERFLGPCTISVRPDGLHVSLITGNSVVLWWAVSDLDVSEKYMVIYAALGTISVPRRAFPDAAAFDDFVHAVRTEMDRRAPGPE